MALSENVKTKENEYYNTRFELSKNLLWYIQFNKPHLISPILPIKSLLEIEMSLFRSMLTLLMLILGHKLGQMLLK